MLKEEPKISRGSSACSACERRFEPQEEHYSALFTEGDDLIRRDVCAGCWKGRPPEALCCWRAKRPETVTSPKPGAHVPALLDLFLEMQRRAEEQNPAFMYVIALMLIRRRKLRVEEQSDRTLVLSRPSTEERFTVAIPTMTDEDLQRVQDKLMVLLDGIQPSEETRPA